MLTGLSLLAGPDLLQGNRLLLRSWSRHLINLRWLINLRRLIEMGPLVGLLGMRLVVLPRLGLP